MEVESESISRLPSRTSTSSSPSRHMTIRRSSDLLTNLKVRSSVSHSVRSYLNDGLDFVEVETPTLFKSTPEGAREFLVPSRKRGKFYALTQSPQQYKQILMSAGTSLQNHSLNSHSQTHTLQKVSRGTFNSQDATETRQVVQIVNPSSHKSIWKCPL